MTRKKQQPSLHPIVPKRGGGRKRVVTHSHRRPSFLKFVAKWLLVLGLWGMLFVGGAVLWFAKDLPDIARSANFERRASIIVKASDGSVIARYGEMKGENLGVKDMPPHLVHAILATEDRRFYQHFGIDPIGIARAMAINLIKGRFVQGGSTITQQLAKNLFLTHDRNLTRKIQEALLALWLEHELTKDEILSAYMNRVYLGSGVYGMSAAAGLYFDKDVHDISLREAAILAGLLKAPSRYSPLNNPKLAKERSDVVLAAMLDAGYIKKSDMDNLSKAPPQPQKKPTGGKASRYFADWVIDGMDDLVGAPDMDMVVETTLDPVIQERAEISLNQILTQYGAEKHVSQGGVLTMRPDGAVLAMVGGKDYAYSEFNRTTQALRSPGSSFKPVVFLAALERGWHPYSHVLDAPITEGKYRPENFGGKYFGEVTMAEALARSMNTATIRIAQSIGISGVVQTAKNLGIISKLEPDLSLALGSSGVSMLEMTLAYATIANGGYRTYPYAITKISTSDGRILYERKESSHYYRVVDPQYTRALTQMMQSVVDFGTGQRAKMPFPVAGKTGTSQESRDAWFIGFSDQIVMSVWIGNDDNSPMNNVTGGSLPATIWHEVMAYSHGRYKSVAYNAPNLSNQGTQPQNTSSDSVGFSGLLGRLLGGEESPAPQRGQQSSGFTPKQRPANDYSGLNE